MYRVITPQQLQQTRKKGVGISGDVMTGPDMNGDGMRYGWFCYE